MIVDNEEELRSDGFYVRVFWKKQNLIGEGVDKNRKSDVYFIG